MKPLLPPSALSGRESTAQTFEKSNALMEQVWAQLHEGRKNVAEKAHDAVQLGAPEKKLEA